jgi:SAM-dependent methyltransferase
MNKPEEEFNWWKNFVREKGSDFSEVRKQDWEDRSKNLLGLRYEKGLGLDYGSGPLSMLEYSGLCFDAIDPLMDKYRTIQELPENYYVDTDKTYDWVLCCNVLDHTDRPDLIIEDIKKKLKPGGHLYLEVNFDDILGNCHFEIYNKEKVDSLIDLKRDYEITDRIDKDLQTAYYARYTNNGGDSVLPPSPLGK